MPDMLCPLLNLPPILPAIERVQAQEIVIRRPNPWERSKVYDFIAERFSRSWADETSVAFSHQPISCFVACHQKDVVGFSAYECTRRNFFGPTGVIPEYERKGIGMALLLASLHGLRDLGYVYAIIGSVSSTTYYEKNVGAVEIPFGSEASIYRV